MVRMNNEKNTEKEEFMQAIETMYDNATLNIEKEKSDDFFNLITDPDMAIRPCEVFDTFMFLDRTIYLTDEITPYNSQDVFEKITLWNKIDKMDNIPIKDRTPIKIYIDTPGGNIDAVLTIISSIQISETPVYTITIGTGYSGGFFIGICGHKRYGLRYSSYLFHEGAAENSGDAHKVLQRINFYKIQLDKLKEITLDNTQISESEYEKHKKDDWFMDAEEALKYGIIDEIIEKI